MNRSKKNKYSRRSAFTLMELMIVSILMTIVMMITAQFWRWFSPGLTDLVAREHILRESRLLIQTFADDFGAAANAYEITGSKLGIDTNGDESSEIFYQVIGGDSETLWRILPNGTGRAVADCVSNFQVEEDPADPNCKITVLFEANSYNRNLPFKKELVFYWVKPD